MSWHAKSSVCRQPFNFLLCMRKIWVWAALVCENLAGRDAWRRNNGQRSFADARLTRCYKPVKNKKKPVFFNLFVQISGRIWTVVGRGYFSHASSYRENVASARRVSVTVFRRSNFYRCKHWIHQWVHIPNISRQCENCPEWKEASDCYR